MTRALVQGRPEVERSIDYVMKNDFMKGSTARTRDLLDHARFVCNALLSGLHTCVLLEALSLTFSLPNCSWRKTLAS